MFKVIFAKEKTSSLMKKFLCYKLMGSDFFINFSLTILNGCYKTMGVRLTNFCINSTVGSLFTSGESIKSLVKDIQDLEQHNIYGLSGYVVEGLHTYDDEKIQKFYQHMLESIHAQTEGKVEGHFALKLTALISTDIMTRMSHAQQVYMNEMLKFNKQESIDISDLRNSLLERGIHFEEHELTQLFESLKYKENNSDTVSRLEIYSNAHLFRLDEGLRNNLTRRIAIGSGVGLTENDL